MFWTECKQVSEEGVRDYLQDQWNIMDITMIALYTTSYTIQFVVAYHDRPIKGKFTEIDIVNEQYCHVSLSSQTVVLVYYSYQHTNGRK